MTSASDLTRDEWRSNGSKVKIDKFFFRANSWSLAQLVEGMKNIPHIMTSWPPASSTSTRNPSLLVGCSINGLLPKKIGPPPSRCAKSPWFMVKLLQATQSPGTSMSKVPRRGGDTLPVLRPCSLRLQQDIPTSINSIRKSLIQRHPENAWNLMAVDQPRESHVPPVHHFSPNTTRRRWIKRGVFLTEHPNSDPTMVGRYVATSKHGRRRPGRTPPFSNF